ncbi:MAG TPA: amino acid permease [Steroidobacteraceae bacterium]|jgi:APA family basic amino acid/polyamine antiporter
MNLFRTKPVQAVMDADAAQPGEVTLKRVLTARHLVLLGIGAVIGAGIFVLTGHAAANHAGPAVVLSFVIAGVACGLAGLCYAEFASMLPVSGSAYSYAYATLGEFTAWFIGWMLVLEYTFAAATVSVGWSGYFTGLLDSISSGLGVSVSLPAALTSAPFDLVEGRVVATGSIVNLPAVAIATAIAALCYRGITQSAFVNSIIVAIKLVVIFLFMGFSLQFLDTSNWTPFIPESQGPGQFGWDGVLRAASIVFFAYIGFDAVSTAAQETKNPQRDMPIGILGSLAICTLIYIAMSAVMTGIMPYTMLGTPKPVATALETYPSLAWLKTLVEVGAIAGLSSVILVMMVGQPRIFYSMARDGLIPPAFGRVHATFRTPHVGTIVVGITAALLAALLPIGRLGEMVSMGTLLAFATVCIGIPVLRRTRPDLARSFRVPMAPVVGILGAAACLYLFWQSFQANWHWMSGWIVIGLAIYFGYSRKHSKLNR